MRAPRPTTTQKRSAPPFPVPIPTNGKDLAGFRRGLLGWYDANRRDLPWRSLAILTASGSAKSCCSRRVWRPCLITTAFSSNAFPMSKLWPRLGKTRCLPHGADSATTGARACCINARRNLFESTAVDFRELLENFRRSRASDATLPPPSPASRLHEPVAVVDGNVERVLQRLTGVNLAATQNWEQAQSLLASSRPGDFNQAMMELGATVCMPREPLCLACPVRKWCATRGESPRAAPPPRQNKKEIWCVLDCRKMECRNGGGAEKVRLVQRPKKDSLMAGMWELPQLSDPAIVRRAGVKLGCALAIFPPFNHRDRLHCACSARRVAA